MSAFIVSENTMHAAICGALSLRRDWTVRLVAPTLAAASDNFDDADALGSSLYALNQAAIDQRYPGQPDMAETPLYCFPPMHHVEPVAAYKALRCLIYQCSEGDVYGSPVFKELEEIAAAVAHEIVRKLPAWDDARTWA